MEDTKPTDALRFWKSKRFSELSWLSHGVTERTGGVSLTPFTSLNLGLHVGDAAEIVCRNRERVATAVGLNLTRMVCAEQVHGSQVAVITGNDAGRGATTTESAISGVDALVTGESDLLLTLFFADCLPVLLADTERHVVAVAHAGWRGLIGGVLENTLERMAQQFGSRPQSVIAAIGPGVSPCCFEVGAEVAAHFPTSLIHRQGNEKPHVDLPGAARLRLIDAGIPADRIDGADLCTTCYTERFFSHRREQGRTGRMGAFITKHT